MTTTRKPRSKKRSVTTVPVHSNYLCPRCHCYGGKFCHDFSVHIYVQPQR